MELTFENLLYNIDGLDKPPKAISESNIKRSQYPGKEVLIKAGYNPKINWSAKDSSNESGFTLPADTQEGEFVFAIIENGIDNYSLFAYSYLKDKGQLKPLDGKRDDCAIGYDKEGHKKYSIPIKDMEKYDCKGSVQEINDYITKLLTTRAEIHG